MYVLEYFVYHLKPYGYDTVIKEDCKKIGENTDQSTVKGGHSDSTIEFNGGNENGTDENSGRKRQVHATFEIQDDEIDIDNYIDKGSDEEDEIIEEEDQKVDIDEDKVNKGQEDVTDKTLKIGIKLDADDTDKLLADPDDNKASKHSKDDELKKSQKNLLKMTLQKGGIQEVS